MARRDHRTADRDWRTTPQRAHQPPRPPAKPRVTVGHVLGYALIGLATWAVLAWVIDVARAV